MRLSSTGKTPIHLIDQPHALQQSLQELAGCDILSFDLEFDNNSYGYGVTLCLVQVATPRDCYVIYPLHSLGCYPQNLYDTEVVARLLNYEHTSLTVLLREKLAVTMDKKQQRSNWLRRPLTEAQVRYAAEDVIWLHPLKAILEAEAAEWDLLPFVREEQELLSTTIYPGVTKTNFLKASDLYSLSPREQYIANELLRYRDELARHMNRPAYQVMGEELVRELAAGSRLPQSIVEGPGVHPRFKNTRFVDQLLKRLEQARKAAADQNLSSEKQRQPRLTPAQHAAMQKAAGDREKIFVPIKQALEQQFGSHATKFMLSNKMVSSLVNGSISLQDLPAYRQALIRNIAAAAGIDLGRYDGGRKMG